MKLLCASLLGLAMGELSMSERMREYVKLKMTERITADMEPALTEAILLHRDGSPDAWLDYMAALEDELMNNVEEKAWLTQQAVLWDASDYNESNILTKEEHLLELMKLDINDVLEGKAGSAALKSKLDFLQELHLLPKAISKEIFVSWFAQLPDELFPSKEAVLTGALGEDKYDFLDEHHRAMMDSLAGKIPTEEADPEELKSEASALLFLLAKQFKDSRDTERNELIRQVVKPVKKAHDLINQ